MRPMQIAYYNSKYTMHINNFKTVSIKENEASFTTTESHSKYCIICIYCIYRYNNIFICSIGVRYQSSLSPVAYLIHINIDDLTFFKLGAIDILRSQDR